MTGQREALELTITAGGRRFGEQHEALLALCRLLADQLDQAGAAASSRLSAAYLSALKDVDRVLRGIPVAESAGKLAELRRRSARTKVTPLERTAR